MAEDRAGPTPPAWVSSGALGLTAHPQPAAPQAGGSNHVADQQSHSQHISGAIVAGLPAHPGWV